MRTIGRYELWQRIAAGGMGAVHLGCIRGEAGFRRAVAIKSMHPAIAGDAGSVASFIDEARLAARLRHPNLVSTLDVASAEGELILVMEYVHGESLARLAPARRPTPAGIAVAIAIGALRGLHAAHEATGDDGELLDLVHRDVSPQNVIVGVDGVPRIADFGVAKASGRINSSGGDSLKGKLAYMAPEQLSAGSLDRRTDVFALGIVCWEILTGDRLFHGTSEAATIKRVLDEPIDRPSKRMPSLPPVLDVIVMKALSRRPEDRYANAREMATALEATGLDAGVPAVGEWVALTAKTTLAERAAIVTSIERADASPAALERFAEEIARQSSADLSDELRTLPLSRDSLTTNGAATVETETLGTKSHGASRWPLLALAVFGFLGVVGVSAAFAYGRRTSVESAPAATTPDFPPAPPLPAPAPAPVEPVLELSADPVPSPSARPARSAHPRPRGTVRGGPNCVDPYTRDQLGRKIYKRECLTAE